MTLFLPVTHPAENASGREMSNSAQETGIMPVFVTESETAAVRCFSRVISGDSGSTLTCRADMKSSIASTAGMQMTKAYVTADTDERSACVNIRQDTSRTR